MSQVTDTCDLLLNSYRSRVIDGKGYRRPEKTPLKVHPKTREKTREKAREKIIRSIVENPGITTKELAEITGLTVKGIEWNIKKLKDEKILKRVGPDKGGH